MSEQQKVARKARKRKTTAALAKEEPAPAQQAAPPEGIICAACGQSALLDTCGACTKSVLLDGRYRLTKVLGRGGAGVTYQSTRLSDGRVVAIKEVAFRHARDPKDLEAARREADILKQLSHPNIPRYLDHLVFGEGKNAGLYIVQEFIEGSSIQQEMEARRYTERDVLEIADGLLAVLEHLHGLSPPVIHRDLKPSNIMRKASGEMVLIDFGSVKDALEDPKLGGNTLVGTHGYMAPEQYEGSAGPATDLYMIGVLMVALLSRKEPASMTRAGGRLEWQDKVVVSEGTRELLEWLLEHDLSRRASGAAEVRARIREIKKRKVAAPPVAKQQVSAISFGRFFRLAMAAFGIFAAGATTATFLATPPRPPVVMSAHAARQPYRDDMPAEGLKQFCKDGYARACTRYAEELEKAGQGEAAEPYLEDACARSNVKACSRLAERHQESATKARRSLNELCNAGSNAACDAASRSR